MKTLDDFVDRLQAMVKKEEEQRRQIEELDSLRQRLQKEESDALAHLGGLGADKLSAASEDGGQFDAATRRKVQLLRDVQTKLEIVPGVRAMAQAELAGLRPRIRSAIAALSSHCEQQASAKLSELHAKYLQDLAPVCGAGTERLNAAARSIALNSDLEQWRLAFREQDLAEDLAAAAEERIALAQQFAQGLPCPNASDRGADPIGAMVGAIAARGRF